MPPPRPRWPRRLRAGSEAARRVAAWRAAGSPRRALRRQGRQQPRWRRPVAAARRQRPWGSRRASRRRAPARQRAAGTAQCGAAPRSLCAAPGPLSEAAARAHSWPSSRLVASRPDGRARSAAWHYRVAAPRRWMPSKGAKWRSPLLRGLLLRCWTGRRARPRRSEARHAVLRWPGGRACPRRKVARSSARRRA